MSSTTSSSGYKIPDNAPEPPDNAILKHLAWSRMWRENDNVIWTVIGDTGKGKSYASLRLAEIIDPNFTVDQIAQNILEFVQLVNDDSLDQGSVIVFEEGSVEASAYNWHSVSNRVFAKVLDTWRSQNRMAIINLPNFMALEKGARRRTNGIVEMQHALPWNGYSEAKFIKYRVHPRYDDPNHQFPTLEGRTRKKIRFKMPSQELIDDYEKLKDSYNQHLWSDLLEELKADLEGKENEMSPTDMANDIIDGDIEEYISDNHGQRYIDRSLIELDYDIGANKSKKVKKAILRQVDLDVM